MELTWLNNLKVGDPVIIRGRYNSHSLSNVTRLTKTQIIVANSNQRFRRKDGYLVGKLRDIYYQTRLIEYDDKLAGEIRIEQKREKLRNIVRSSDLLHLSLADLQIILSLMEKSNDSTD